MNMSFSILGLTIGLIVFAESLRPALLPINAPSQIIFSGLAAAIGYDIGLLLGLARKRFGILKEISLNIHFRYLLYAIFVLVGLYFTSSRLGWQNEQKILLQLDVIAIPAILVLLGSFVVAWLAVRTGILIRSLARFLTLRLRKRIEKILVYGAIWLLVMGLGYAVFSLSIFAIQILVESTSRSPTLSMVQPISPLRSGSSESLVSWDELEQKGQEFVSRRPDEVELRNLFDSGITLVEPIRIYASIANEPDLEKRVDLVMQEFERMRAFERKTIVMFTPTGSGWVNTVAIESAEYLTKGNVVSIAIQYSNRSAIPQYLINRDIAGDASLLLFSKIRQRIDLIPAETRPKVYIYGESLGSLGSQKIFVNKTIEEIAQQVDGALWVGSPSASELWSSLVGRRGGIAPIVEEGRIVRFGTDAKDLMRLPGEWGPSRVAFLYNSTDPVVWFNWNLAYQSPEWLQEPRAPEISEHVRWQPLLTIAHLTFELVSAGHPPSGVGHNYNLKIPCAMASILQIQEKNGLTCNI